MTSSRVDMLIRGFTRLTRDDAPGRTGLWLLVKIIHTLKPIQTAQIHLAGQTITASHQLTPQAQTILNALDIDPEI